MILLVVTVIKSVGVLSCGLRREKKTPSQETAQKVMNEKQFYIEFYTARKVTNRGSKTCVKPFSAKLLSAFENEKITVYAE